MSTVQTQTMPCREIRRQSICRIQNLLQEVRPEAAVKPLPKAVDLERKDSGVDLSYDLEQPEQQQFQNALLITPERKYKLVSDFAAPQSLAPHEVMIRNRATGLNHIDWKSV